MAETARAICDVDGTPIVEGETVLHIEDEQEWLVFAMHPGEAMQLYLCREPKPEDFPRRALMCAADGSGFRVVTK